MTRGWILLALSCTLALPESAHGQSSPALSEASEGSATLAPPRANASLRGPNPSYIGQMVRVEVELLRDDREKDKPAPFFPEIRVHDAIALLAEHAPPPEQRVVDDVTFLVQKRIYLVFPQVAGNVTVPKISVALPGPDGKSLLVSTHPLELHADVPRGTGARLPLIARNFSLQRTIDGDLGRLRVGDAFTVSLKLEATDTDPVLLPALELPDIVGLSRYPGEAATRAQAERGEYRAERTERVTYVANDFGFYQLPRMSVFWLDPATGNYAEAVAPPLSFRARVNPHLGTGCVGGLRAVGRWGGLLGGLAIVCVALLRILRRAAAKREARALVHKSADERAAFAALCAAAGSDRDGAALSALYFWLRCVMPGVPTLHAWLKTSSDKVLHQAIMDLETRISTGGGPGQANDLVAPLAAYRKGRRALESKKLRLPEMNERSSRSRSERQE